VSLPAYAVVAVGYDSQSEWNGFFESIRTSSVSPVSIVVVDNSPELSLRAKQWPTLPLTVIHEPANRGYGSAANRGIQSLPSGVEWVAVCNPDTRFLPETVETLLEHRDSFGSTGVLGPGILTPSGDIFPSARAIPGIRIGVGHALMSKIWPANPWTAKYLGSYDSTEPQSVGWLSGAFLLINRRVCESIGGFDEGFFMFFEDVDLGRRVKQAGFRNVYVPSAQVTHSGAHSTSAHEKKMLLAHHRSAEIFLAKLYPHRYQWPLRALLRVGLRVRARIQTRNIA